MDVVPASCMLTLLHFPNLQFKAHDLKKGATLTHLFCMLFAWHTHTHQVTPVYGLFRVPCAPSLPQRQWPGSSFPFFGGRRSSRLLLGMFPFFCYPLSCHFSGSHMDAHTPLVFCFAFLQKKILQTTALSIYIGKRRKMIF